MRTELFAQLTATMDRPPWEVAQFEFRYLVS